REASDVAEIAPEVPRVDTKTWQRATYLALFFTLIILAAFFYLVQTARKINFTPNEVAGQQAKPAPGTTTSSSAQNVSTVPPVPVNPALRLYTDLPAGTVSIDGGRPTSKTVNSTSTTCSPAAIQLR